MSEAKDIFEYFREAFAGEMRAKSADEVHVGDPRFRLVCADCQDRGYYTEYAGPHRWDQGCQCDQLHEEKWLETHLPRRFREETQYELFVEDAAMRRVNRHE